MHVSLMHELRVISQQSFKGNKLKEATNIQIMYVKKHIHPAENIRLASSELIRYEYSKRLIYFKGSVSLCLKEVEI